MKIRYFGHSYFLFEGNDYKIALDPFGDIGLKEVKTHSDYIFCSHEHYDHNNRSLVDYKKEVENDYPFTVIETFHDEKRGALRGKNKVLLFLLDGFKIAFLGDLGEGNNACLIEKLKGVDLILIPVGGTYTIDSNEAYNYVKKISPKAIIPMHYHLGSSTVDICSVESFLKKFDQVDKRESPFEYNGESGVIYLECE